MIVEPEGSASFICALNRQLEEYHPLTYSWSYQTVGEGEQIILPERNYSDFQLDLRRGCDFSNRHVLLFYNCCIYELKFKNLKL